MIQHNYIGCDICKDMLDVFDPSSRSFRRLANRAGPIEAFAAGLAPGRDFVVFEATGVHDRLLRHALAEAGIASTRRNPVQTRRFAEAGGLLAKTDKLDARMLSDYGRRFTPAPDQPPCRQRERIAALARRRDQLVEARAREARHLGEAFDPDVIADIEAAVACLAKRIATIEAVIASAIAEADAATAATFAILRSAPGVGPVTALTLIAHLPELGGRSPKTIASLAGLAPRNNDSGTRRGRRPIRGGRPRVRKALYMAALGAIRAAPRFKAFYSAIAARSGSRKLAVIAAARKLLTILNAMQRDQKAYA
ncbi:IS110 family transposase [Mesorhizobium sp. AaZ16]|uniref:IS110 family transposase n=1 Tax=Mesorhizobium sp. AaZ16 TaxID=3402289 RepID=UPI00374FC040